MKIKPVHLISEPAGCVALRTACGRELSPKVERTPLGQLVTCRNCRHTTSEAGGAWLGLEGYSWRKAKPREKLSRVAREMAAEAEGFTSPKVIPRARARATVEVEVKVRGRDSVQKLRRLLAAAERVLDTVDTIEARAMAADGPVTPTLRAATEQELRRIWLAAKAIARTKWPKIVGVGAELSTAPTRRKA